MTRHFLRDGCVPGDLGGGDLAIRQFLRDGCAPGDLSEDDLA